MKKSFTLIELLVVIAIIAILAAILLPALNSARERGRAAACISNMKQITVASAMYMDDFDGYVASPEYGQEGVYGYHCWKQGYDRYLVTNWRPQYNTLWAPVWNCPTNRLPYLPEATADSGWSGVNCSMVGNTSTVASNLKINHIKNPSIKVLAFDASKNPLGSSINATSVNYSKYGFKSCYYARHGNGIHFMKVAGNVSWESLDSEYCDIVSAARAGTVWLYDK